MADAFTILGTVPTVELVGGAQTRPVRQINAVANESGATFSFIVTAPDFAPSHIELAAHDLAAGMNEYAAVPGVVYVQLYQGVNRSGQFEDRLAFTVQSASGASSEDFDVLYSTIAGDRFGKRVAAARANMAAIEAL